MLDCGVKKKDKTRRDGRCSSKAEDEETTTGIVVTAQVHC